MIPKLVYNMHTCRAVKWNEQSESSIEVDSIKLELNSLIVVNKSSSTLTYARLINKPSKLDSFVIRVAQLYSIRKYIYVISQFKNIKIINYKFLLGLICSSSCKLDSFVINESTSGKLTNGSSSISSHMSIWRVESKHISKLVHLLERARAQLELNLSQVRQSNIRFDSTRLTALYTCILLINSLNLISMFGQKIIWDIYLK